MDHPAATSRALQTPELLCKVLSYLQPGKLLQLQRVSQHWGWVIRNTSNLCATTFAGPRPAQNTAAGPPRLNTFVISRLRWCPNMELTLLNSPRFDIVAADPILQAMAYENASWRKQYLTWPPVSKIAVIHGTISQEEPSLPDLHLTCNARDISPLHEPDDGPPPIVFCVRDFPHNAGQECIGITVLDMIYGLRLHYVQRIHTLRFWFESAGEGGRGGEILARFEVGEPVLTVDVTFM